MLTSVLWPFRTREGVVDLCLDVSCHHSTVHKQGSTSLARPGRHHLSPCLFVCLSESSGTRDAYGNIGGWNLGKNKGELKKKLPHISPHHTLSLQKWVRAQVNRESTEATAVCYLFFLLFRIYIY